MSVFFNDAYMFVKLIIFGKQKKLQYSSLQYINVGLCLHSLLNVRPVFKVFNMDCFLPKGNVYDNFV